MTRSPRIQPTRRQALFALAGSALVLPSCGGGGGGGSSGGQASPGVLQQETFPQSDGSTAVARLSNDNGGSIATWVDPGTGLMSQSLYLLGSNKVRSFYDTDMQLTRAVDEVTGNFMTATRIDASRVEYNIYDASGRWLGGYAVLTASDGTVSAAPIVSSSALTDAQITAELAGPVSASMTLVSAGSGLGNATPITNTSVLTAARAAPSTTLLALLDRLTDRVIGSAHAQSANPARAVVQVAVGGLLTVWAANAPGMAVALLGVGTAATVAGVLGTAVLAAAAGYMFYSAAVSLVGRNTYNNLIDRVTGTELDNFSRNEEPSGETSTSMAQLIAGNASAQASAGLASLQSLVTTGASVARTAASTLTAAATSAWQQVTSAAPPGVTPLTGVAVDTSGQTYPLSGSYTPGSNGYTFSGTGSGGGAALNGSGTVSGAGSYTYTNNGSQATGSVTSTSQTVSACQTQQSSGGQGTFTRTYNLGKDSGSIEVSYQMYSVPDKMELFSQSGQRLFSTGGLVSGGNTVTVPYAGGRNIFVVISAPNSGTAWDYSIGCP